jgi:hypothetical protein
VTKQVIEFGGCHRPFVIVRGPVALPDRHGGLRDRPLLGPQAHCPRP